MVIGAKKSSDGHVWRAIGYLLLPAMLLVSGYFAMSEGTSAREVNVSYTTEQT
jgi:hypothetical protein